MKKGDVNKWWTYADLVQEARELASKVAAKTELAGIAGVPRSGMLAATAMALHLGLPLYEANESGVRSLAHGSRLDNKRFEGRILVVEDSLNSGRRFRQLRQRLGDQYIYAAVFCRGCSLHLVNHVGVHLDLPHWFEWWLWGSRALHHLRIGIDFDGILCEDCRPEQDDDGAKYLDFLANVRPLVRCAPYGVPVVITGRLEKYREQTAAWLRKHGQVVQEVIHAPWASKAERSRHSIAEWKAQQCIQRRLCTFIESDPRQAKIIYEIAKINVACPALGTVFPSRRRDL